MADALKRRIGLPLLTAYGVGVMVGAGIYVLVGAVAADAGIWAPLAFLFAGLVAAPTALSYAEFSTRLPEAGGEAVYVSEGLGLQWLGVLVGLAIVVTGTISAAAVLRGGAGYLTSVVPLPMAATIVVMGLSLIAVAIIGVQNDDIVPELAWQMGRPVRYGGEFGGFQERASYMADIALRS
ncbi:MAG: amino acid permease, partial [Pseudomonadota bacterium]|nr:amino acid permease [Pseudomonadota bacterium]